MSLKQVLENNKVQFDDNSKIVLADNVKHIKIDVGLSFDAPHSQNWIDNDIANENNIVVFGFEANPTWNNYILSPIKNRNFKDYHEYTVQLKYEHLYSKFFLVPVALGNVSAPTEMDFYVPERSQGCCSLLYPNKKLMGDVVETHRVPVYNLSDFFDLIDFTKIPYIDYLKVDVQGYDINVLKGAGSYLSERVVYVTAEPEVEQYIGAEENSTSNMVAYMQSIGFIHVNHKCTADPTFLNRKFEHLVDSIYIWQHY